MAIFQPTNIVPSSYTQGTIDVNDPMIVSWQVNGNSAMTAFQIDFYLNDTNSTYVTTSGKISEGCPFYGTDRFGNPQFFTYNANGQSWSEWSTNKLTNGNSYKLKITQYYNEGGIEKSLAQTSQSVFITRSTPTLNLFTTANDYVTDKTPLASGNSLSTSIGYFHADYNQAQGDSVRWIRWQVATANNGVIGDILADTGDIYTPTLNYEYNGFFNKESYAIRATCESENGQQTNSNPANDGWVFFNIQIDNQGHYNGNFTAKSLKKENATLLEWEGIAVIPPTISPEGYEPIISNGSVTLAPKNQETGEECSITWNRVGTKNNLDDMNFPSPWTVGWKEKNNNDIQFVKDVLDKPNGNGVFAVSPDGKTLVIAATPLPDCFSIYSVNGTEVTFLRSIQLENNLGLNHTMTAMAFSPDGKMLVICESGNPGFAVKYYVDENFEYAGTLGEYKLSSELFSTIYSPDGKALFIGGEEDYSDGFHYYIHIFSVDGKIIEYINNLEIATYYGSANRPSFYLSPDGKMLVTTTNKLYSVEGTKVTYAKDIDVEYGSIAKTMAFSPDGKYLYIGDYLTHLYIYAVDGENVNYIKQLGLNHSIIGMAFSPDGEILVISGAYNGISDIYLYSVYDLDIEYSGILSSLNNISQYDPFELVFSPDGGNLYAGSLLKSNQQGMVSLFSIQKKTIGKLLVISSIDTDINIISQTLGLVVLINNAPIHFGIPLNTNIFSVLITPDSVLMYADNKFLKKASILNDYIQKSLTSISIMGGDYGSTAEGISVFQGNGANIISLYERDPDFEPVWNSSEYKLYMTANFNNNLDGGSGTSFGEGFRIYRSEISKNILFPIASVPFTVNQLKDFGTLSNRIYKYFLYAYDSNGAFMSSVETDNVIATCFKNYSLLVCDYDEKNDEYHVRKQYLFALNLSAGSVGNNNSPTLNANFTPYPTRMPSTQNYASGTLQGLIGAIYTVPALVEQMGNYKHTTKPSTMDYFDSVDLEKELYDLSVAPYQLFLRDMKGRLRMIHTSGPISMTTNIKQKQQSISISLPWVEIGDASDVTIIQTPDDYGWNNDNQVLDVQLDVDVETGELSATYPFPYNGTKFYLTGVNKENLTAKTPIEVTPAQFNLSAVAEEPNDGELSATVTVNTENN